MGWMEYYILRFLSSSTSIVIKHPHEFSIDAFNESSYVIVTTDDDTAFPIDYMDLPNASKKVICYNHNIALRQPCIRQHITTRPYTCESRKDTPYMYPIYPMISINEKREALAKESTINIAVVGGSWNSNNFWKCLFPKNNMDRITIFFIHRNHPGVWARMDRYVKSICRNTEIYLDCDTFKLLELLKRSHYLAFLTDIDQFVSHSCSGSVGLAFNTGCTMLMTRKYNSEFKFRNPIYFDDCPELTNTPDLECVFNERDTLMKANRETFETFIAPAAE
jgi:hypothetical protein